MTITVRQFTTRTRPRAEIRAHGMRDWRIRDRTGVPRARLAAALLVAITVGAVGAEPAQAQASGDGFLFREPRGSVAVRGGLARPRAGGDLFSFVTDQLTLAPRDFRGAALGLDVALRLAPRVDVVIGTAYAGASSGSEFRRLVDQNDLPIAQTTSFQRVPVTASVRAYLTPRGRSVGRLAWVPARFAPYVGAGGGAVWYRFSQRGDFVDANTGEVFGDRLASSGWAPAAQTMAGLDYSLTPRLALTGEGKYLWAKAGVGQSYTGFRPIDLSGSSATLGLYVRF